MLLELLEICVSNFWKIFFFFLVYWGRKCLLLCKLEVRFQFLSKRVFPHYRSFRRLLLVCFCFSYKVSLLRICDCLAKKKRRGLPIPFSIIFHFLVCYMFPVIILRRIFLFENIEIFYFVNFYSIVPSRLAKLFVSFPYYRVYLLTYLHALCLKLAIKV